MAKRSPKIRWMHYMYGFGFILLLMLVMSATHVSPAHAQGSQELLTAISQQMGQSMQALTDYSYQQRTEVQVNGETKSVQLSQVAFGPDKQPLITPLSQQPSDDTGFGLRGRIKEHKEDEMEQQIQQIVHLSNTYLMLSKDKMQQLVSQGQVLVNPDNGNLTVNASGLLQMGDHVTINCDGMTKNRIQTQVQTTAGEDPMTITAQYETMPAGLNYNAQTQISVPTKGLQITINTLNYQKQ